MDEGITEVQVVIKRITLNGEDPWRFVELLWGWLGDRGEGL